MNNRINIGEKIRFLRKEKGINQTMFAKMLNTTQDTISLWELGKSLPDALSIIAICNIFGVSSDYILGLKEI